MKRYFFVLLNLVVIGAAYAQEIIYEEHFESKNGSLSVRPEMQAIVKVKDGKLRIASENASVATIVDFKDFKLPENFSIEISSTWQSHKGDAIYGFGFGWNPFRILVFNDGYVRVNYWSSQSNQWERPLEKFAGTTPYQTAPGSVNKLKLVCYGKKAEWFINDLSVGSFEAFFLEKFFQLVVEGQEDVLFDDVIIRKLAPKSNNLFTSNAPIINSPEGYKTTMDLDLLLSFKNPRDQLIDSFICDNLKMKVNPIWKLNSRGSDREISLGVETFSQLKSTFPDVYIPDKQWSMLLTLNVQNMSVAEKKKRMGNQAYDDMIQYFDKAGIDITDAELDTLFYDLNYGQYLTTNQGLKGEFWVYNWISDLQSVCWLIMLIPKDDQSIYFASVSLNKFVSGAFSSSGLSPDIVTQCVFPNVDDEDEFAAFVKEMYKTIVVPR